MIAVVFCFKQKTAYEMRISDWSSDVCSSDLGKQAYQTPRGGDRSGAVLSPEQGRGAHRSRRGPAAALGRVVRQDLRYSRRARQPRRSRVGDGPRRRRLVDRRNSVRAAGGPRPQAAPERAAELFGERLSPAELARGGAYRRGCALVPVADGAEIGSAHV